MCSSSIPLTARMSALAVKTSQSLLGASGLSPRHTGWQHMCGQHYSCTETCKMWVRKSSRTCISRWRMPQPAMMDKAGGSCRQWSETSVKAHWHWKHGPPPIPQQSLISWQMQMLLAMGTARVPWGRHRVWAFQAAQRMCQWLAQERMQHSETGQRCDIPCGRWYSIVLSVYTRFCQVFPPPGGTNSAQVRAQ